MGIATLNAKPGFLTELKATAIPPNLWRLDAELQYVTFVNGVAELIVAETGFVNDMASIPRLFRTLRLLLLARSPGLGIDV